MSGRHETGSRLKARSIWFALVGAMVGFIVTYRLYLWLNPLLEARRDWLRELQGLLFTLVPLGTATGAALGWRLGSRESS